MHKIELSLTCFKKTTPFAQAIPTLALAVAITSSSSYAASPQFVIADQPPLMIKYSSAESGSDASSRVQQTAAQVSVFEFDAERSEPNPLHANTKAGGARVGLYACSNLGAGISYTSIISSSKYKGRTKGGSYRLVGGSVDPGGFSFQYLSGPYASGWANEYYPAGTRDRLGAVRKVPVIYLGSSQKDLRSGYGWPCHWQRSDPTPPSGWQ